ncbi:MAG: dihydroorotate dehydrogenase electron transfer subunit [Clostridia bacterium]|nr:dihydroorotate dehydrogenase electron transfer subunit [Clostridia bacterium]
MIFTLKEHTQLTPWVWKMVLEGDASGITRPGQFVQIELPGFYLRRPISVCDWTENTLTLVYKVVGEGTEAMSQMPLGQKLDLLTGLGNGFDVSKSGESPLLVGGGVGAPPLYGLCKALVEAGKKPHVILGFNTAEEVFLKEDFENLGVKVEITTVDGSMGTKGFVTACMDAPHDYLYACGPEPMLKAAAFHSGVSGQLSFEERMACGFGACMGCSCKTKYGNKRICKDGPVLVKEEVIW